MRQSSFLILSQLPLLIVKQEEAKPVDQTSPLFSVFFFLLSHLIATYTLKCTYYYALFFQFPFILSLLRSTFCLPVFSPLILKVSRCPPLNSRMCYFTSLPPQKLSLPPYNLEAKAQKQKKNLLIGHVCANVCSAVQRPCINSREPPLEGALATNITHQTRTTTAADYNPSHTRRCG